MATVFDWTGAHPATARRLQAEAERIFERMPQLSRRVKEVGVEKWGENAEKGDGYTAHGGVLILFRHGYASRLQRTPEKLMRHELGHVAQWVLGLPQSEEWAERFATKPTFRAKIRAELARLG
jgi:hypothetical protein